MASIWVEIGGKRFKVELRADGAVLVDGAACAVDLEELEPGVLSLLWTDANGESRSFRCGPEAEAVIVDGERVAYALYDPRSLRGAGTAAEATGPKALKAPMPGRVVRMLVAEGEAVEAGQGCVVIEAMKMQNELKAPRAGVVRRLAAAAGATVGAGAVLLMVE